MQLSTHAIEAMGFSPIISGQSIEAIFYSLHIFEVRGLSSKEGGVQWDNASVAGTNYTLAFGSSVNEICRTILADDYIEDEQAWKKEKNCTPPYAVVRFGPTSRHVATSGYAKMDGNQVVTYDLFGTAKKELVHLAEALPSIEMALACSFSVVGKRVQFRAIDRTVYGITPNNTTVLDIRVTGCATGYASTPLSAIEIESRIQDATRLADLFDPRVARFFQLGIHDEDNLKKFLYHFLAIEIEVHRIFATCSRAQHLQSGAAMDPRVTNSLSVLFENRNNWTSLADRFTWCVVSAWKHLSDDDVKEFKRSEENA